MKTVKAAIAARCRSVALAGVIVVLASYLNPSNAFGQATSVTSYGFRANEGGGGALSTGWVTGNLGNTWAEGEWVPYQLVIDNVQTGYPNLTDFPDIIMSYDFTTADARFVDLVRSIQVGTQQLTDLQGWVNNDGTAYPMGTRAQIEAAQNDVGNVAPLDNVWTLGGGGNFALLNLPNSQVNRDLAGNVGTPTDAERTFRITRADLIAAGVPLTANRIVIYYQLHESRSFVWANSLQEQYDQSPTDDWGGYIYSLAAFAADARNGAGFVPGSSGHIEVEFAGGKKSVPIPIPEQLPGAVSGIKWHDANGNCVIDQGEPTLSGWQVCVSGTLEGIEFEDCDTTDVDGAYSFPNLTSGGSGWLICEAENRTTPAESGYMQTCPTLATAPVGVGAPAACSPPFAAVGWLVNLTVANANQPNMNFGNKRCEVACSGPSDVTIDCSESTDPSNTGIPVITGNCPPIDTSYTDSTTAGNCAAEYVITRTWIITDVGGMKDTCVQFITVVDTTAPVITCEDNKTIDCAEAVVFDEPSATDDCSEVTITILSTIGSAGDCPAESSFTRTWEAISKTKVERQRHWPLGRKYRSR